MPAGAYCFFVMSSPTIIYWFIPIMVIALISIIVCYGLIVRHVQEFARATAQKYNVHPQDHKIENKTIPAATSSGSGSGSGLGTKSNENSPVLPVRKVNRPPIFIRANPMQKAVKSAKKSFMFFVIFLLGWFSAIILCIYELSIGPAIEPLDMMLGTFGSAHSVAVPLAYGFSNDKIWKTLKGFCCCCGKTKKEATRADTSVEEGGSSVEKERKKSQTSPILVLSEIKTNPNSQSNSPPRPMIRIQMPLVPSSRFPVTPFSSPRVV